ncbi:MAG: DUF3047 domain-containing protein [Gammaproteobacteria bacterium]|nr:DUF3047 domain-containing protein [Gammaproteobacteria bacterium]
MKSFLWDNGHPSTGDLVCRTGTIFVALLLAALPVQADQDTDTVYRLDFSDPAAWQPHNFNKGLTRYTFVRQNSQAVVRAESRGSASALTRRISVDLNKTPYLYWSWRVDGVIHNLDERRKSGDDYPARIYIVRNGGWRAWDTIAINYVWSNNQPPESAWPSAYAAQSMMLAVRSGQPEPTRWYHERRNVKQDFKDLLGEDVERVDLIALMTDSDDTRRQASAWYGEIRFEAN